MNAIRLLILTSALIVAACGGGSSPDAADGPGSDDDGSTSTPDETPVTPADDPPDTVSAPGTEPLTDSFRGVTATTIKVGVALLDSRPFVDNGDVTSRFEALAREVNDRGGILGRDLELVVDEFGVLDELGFEEVCTRLTEDEKVFVAITFAFSMDLTCYGGLHETNVINLIEISESDITGSTATVLSVAADPLNTLLDGLDLMAEELDGARVALHVRPERQADLAAVRDHLTSLGAEVVIETVATVYLDDIPADQAQHDIFLERWLTEGAEMVVAIGRGASSAAVGTLDRNGSDLGLVVQGNEANSLSSFGADLARLNLVAIAPVAIDVIAEQGLYGTAECIDFIESATGQMITIRPPVGEPQPLVSTIGACQAMELFELIATAAGPHLDNDTWRAAAEGLGSFALTGTPRAYLEPGRYFAGDPDVELYVYDDSVEGFVTRP